MGRSPPLFSLISSNYQMLFFGRKWFERSLILKGMRRDKKEGLDRGGGGEDDSSRNVIFRVTEDALTKVRNHKGKALSKGHGGLPTKKVLSFRNVRFSFMRVIFRVRSELYLCIWIYCLLHYLHKSEHIYNNYFVDMEPFG